MMRAKTVKGNGDASGAGLMTMSIQTRDPEEFLIDAQDILNEEQRIRKEFEHGSPRLQIMREEERCQK